MKRARPPLGLSVPSSPSVILRPVCQSVRGRRAGWKPRGGHHVYMLQYTILSGHISWSQHALQYICWYLLVLVICGDSSPNISCQDHDRWRELPASGVAHVVLNYCGSELYPDSWYRSIKHSSLWLLQQRNVNNSFGKEELYHSKKFFI